MENKNVEEKNNLEHCGCDCGSECDCGPECDCGDDCHCDDDDCNCEHHDYEEHNCDCGCEEDFIINNKDGKNGFSCCSTSGCFLKRNFFGILIFLLGIFYLGKNMGWWNFDLDWSLFWPILLILIGLMVMLKRKKNKEIINVFELKNVKNGVFLLFLTIILTKSLR
ncbi:MAG TPA: DUF5668 domain-containing protein [bacterium]|nr:DUF5668 domain-containing protein [bacterium]